VENLFPAAGENLSQRGIRSSLLWERKTVGNGAGGLGRFKILVGDLGFSTERHRICLFVLFFLKKNS
jgi:hypothetical protein